MPTLQELLAQQAELDKQIAATQNAERAEAIAKVKSLMAEYNLSMEDLQQGVKGSASGGEKANGRSSIKGSKVAAKFRDPNSDQTWSGRGLQPKWLKAALADGKKIEEFAV